MAIDESNQGIIHEKLLALREAIASDCNDFFTNTMIIDELIDLLIKLTSEDNDVK